MNITKQDQRLRTLSVLLFIVSTASLHGQTDPPPPAPTGLEAVALGSQGNADAFEATGPVLLDSHESRWKGPGVVGAGNYLASNFQVRGGSVEATGSWKNSGAYFAAAQPPDQESQILDRAHSSASKHVAVRMGPGHLGYSLFLGSLSNGSYTRAYLQKDGRYLGIAGNGSWSASADHILRIRASGTAPVTIESWVDGSRLSSLVDVSTPLVSGFPGFWCGGAADPAASRFDSWTDGNGGPAIRLTWSPSPDADVASYTVYRAAIPDGSYSVLAAGVLDTRYTDGQVVAGGRYGYLVVAVDQAGSASAFSPEVMGTIPSGPPITLGWTPPTLNEDLTPLTDLGGFRIYRGSSPGSAEAVIDVGAVSRYTLPALAPGLYYFRVAAYDFSGNESEFSNEISIRIP